MRIIEAIKRSDLTKYENLYNLFQAALSIFENSYGTVENCIESKEKDDLRYLLKITNYVRSQSIYMLAKTLSSGFEDLYWSATLFESPHIFESFMLYMEKNRQPEKRFYQPRINPLKKVAEAIQQLADDELDELFINMPSRVGKTQIVKFGFVWFASRDTEA